MKLDCIAPIPLAELIAYDRGELDEAREADIEAHYFDCAACTLRLQSIADLAAGIVDLVRHAMVSASVTADFVARSVDAGLRIRTYRLGPGEQRACTAAPDDDFVAIRLGLELETATNVDIAVEWTAVETGATDTRSYDEVTHDRGTNEVILLFAAAQVREFPRSQWRMSAVIHEADGERRVGPYTLNHTPWEQLQAR